MKCIAGFDCNEYECHARGCAEVARRVQQSAPSIPVHVVGDPPVAGIKHDDGKPRVSLIPRSFILAVARVLTFGAKKYSAHNWRNGFDWSRLMDAAQRHMLAFQAGEDRDPETGELHLAHAACCIAFLIEHVEAGLGKDDRYRKAAA